MTKPFSRFLAIVIVASVAWLALPEKRAERQLTVRDARPEPPPQCRILTASHIVTAKSIVVIFNGLTLRSL